MHKLLGGQGGTKAGADQIRWLIFWAEFAFLLAHELDAVAQSEWRLLPLLNLMADEPAYKTFVAAHVPLVVFLIWLFTHRSDTVRWRSQLVFDAFLCAHALVHWLMSDDVEYTFHSPLSESMIYGGAVVGLAHLLLLARVKPGRKQL